MGTAQFLVAQLEIGQQQADEQRHHEETHLQIPDDLQRGRGLRPPKPAEEHGQPHAQAVEETVEQKRVGRGHQGAPKDRPGPAQTPIGSQRVDCPR